jgi:hypothetical protein
MSTSSRRATGALSPEHELDGLAHDGRADTDSALGTAGNDLFDQDAPYPDVSPGWISGPEFSGGLDDVHQDETAYAEDSYELGPPQSRPRATVYESLPGMPGRGVVLVTSVVTGLAAMLDFGLTGGLSYFFDMTFVVICLVSAMAVRGHDLFTTGVLPPLVFAVTIGLVAGMAPQTFVASGGISTAFLTGLTAHASGLVFGYGTALVTVAGRAVHHRNR